MAPGMAMCFTDSRSFTEKVQADTKHQQDDADFGQLGASRRSAT